MYFKNSVLAMHGATVAFSDFLLILYHGDVHPTTCLKKAKQKPSHPLVAINSCGP